MGFFKKLLKAVKKPLLNVAKTGLSLASGGLSDKAITIAKAAGTVIKRGKVAKAQKVLDRIPAPALRSMTYKSALPTAASYISPPAIAMPGGAPIAGARRTTKRRKAALPKMPKKVAAKAAKKANKGPSGKGMKDLKALSVSWNAAGKPGKWLDWVKSH